MQFIDTLALDGVRKTADGYLAISAKCARSGIQIYTGDQLGKPDRGVVRVYRPADEVFSDTAMRSYAHRPVTIDHPKTPVDATNWKDVSVGQTDAEVMRDGDTVRVSMLVMDEAAINKINSGQREISMGYSADIEWIDGETPDGEPYDAIQRNHRMNHLAIVAKARGGSELKIGDGSNNGVSAMTDKLTQIVHDGLPVNVPESAAPIVNKWLSDAAATVADMKAKMKMSEEEMKDMKAKKDEMEGELAAMKKKLEEATMTDEALDKLVQDRAALIAEAKPFLDSEPTGSAADIRKAVVIKMLGDEAVKDMSDDAVLGAYKVAVKSGKSGDPITSLLSDGLTSTSVTDSDKAYQQMIADNRNAWKKGA